MAKIAFELSWLTLGRSRSAEVRSLAVTTIQDVVDEDDGLISLREAIAFANDLTAGFNNDGDADGDGMSADVITFDDRVFTGGDSNLIRLTRGELVISDSLTIDASSVGGVVVTGDASGDDVISRRVRRSPMCRRRRILMF